MEERVDPFVTIPVAKVLEVLDGKTVIEQVDVGHRVVVLGIDLQRLIKVFQAFFDDRLVLGDTPLDRSSDVRSIVARLKEKGRTDVT